MRRRRPATPENHDRWLVSYADFITLLFAFFVVMFATAHADKSRAKAISEAIDNALKNGAVATRHKATPAMVKQPDAVAKEDSKKVTPPDNQVQAEELQKPLDALTASLKEEIKSGSIRLALERRGLIIELQTGALFPSGGATLGPAAYPAIKEVATVLNTLPNALRLEGHTDSLPINNGLYQSNWELSAARSIAMLRFLNEKFGVVRQRMAVVGYADTESIESNETQVGRERNRRVDIVVLSSYGMRSEPGTTSATESKGPNANSKADFK